MTDTDFGDPEMIDFGRFRPIIGIDSDTKALLRLPELVCVSPTVFPNGWHTRPLFAGPKSSKNHGFQAKIMDSSCFRMIIELESVTGVLQRPPELACVSPALCPKVGKPLHCASLCPLVVETKRLW